MRRPPAPYYVDFESADGARWCASASSRAEAARIGEAAVASFGAGGDRLGLGFEVEPEELTFFVREGR